MSRWLPDNFGPSGFKNVPSSSIQPTKPEPQVVYNSKFKLDFVGASKDFWVKNVNKAVASYDRGNVTGKYGKYSPDIEDFFNRLFILVKESVISELADKSYTTENLQNQFDIIESAFKMLAAHIKELDKENKIDVDSLCAFLHGFVNGFIDDFAKIKETQNGEEK